MKKRIVLCADDYGQAPAISAGICHLLSEGRLSATSCMVNQPDWSSEAAALNPYHNQVDIGLHFNLTHGRPVSEMFRMRYGEIFPSLNQLILRAYAHQLDQSIILHECVAQIDLFRDAMGCLPAFIDGHQHVHQFPVVRDAVLAAFQMKMNPSTAYIRLPCESVHWWRDLFQVRKWMIAFLGQGAIKRQLVARGIQFNTTFAGAYPFADYQAYRKIFQTFLSSIGNQGIIMCHPGLLHQDSEDPIAKVRYAEYQYFMSNEFLLDCSAGNVELARFNVR